jgi:hypothetical protein
LSEDKTSEAEKQRPNEYVPQYLAFPNLEGSRCLHRRPGNSLNASGFKCCLPRLLTSIPCHPQALFDLEATNQELKSDLKDLYINNAKEIDITSNRKAIIIHVPYRLLKAYHKIHARLVRELEKKFSGKVRRILCFMFDLFPMHGASLCK